MGDIIQANPVIPALRAVYPDAELTWLVFDVWASILSLFRGLDKVMLWRKQEGLREYFRLVSEVRREHFDIVIDLQGLARTALLARLSGAKLVIGAPGMKECGWLLIKEVFPKSAFMHAIERNLETVRYLTGRKSESLFSLAVTRPLLREAETMLEQAGGKMVGIVPKARGAAKQWPAGRFAELIALVHKHDPDTAVVLLGAEGDSVGLEGMGALDLCGKTTLPQMAGVLAWCSVVVGGDTGPVHCSAVLGVPTIVLFGGSDITETAPRGHKVTLINKGLACSPCRGHTTCGGKHPCLNEITAAEVFEKLKPWL